MTRGAIRPAPPPQPVDFGIVAALPIEVAPLVDRLLDVRKYASRGQTVLEGQLDGKLVAIVRTGPGRARAQRGAERLIDGHRPRWLLSAGFCGALDPAIVRNALYLPVEAANLEGHRFPIDWPEGFPAPGPFERRGSLLTTDEVVLKAEVKAKLHRETGCDLVDMETSAVVAYARERGVRCLAVRVVSDDAQGDLPPEILSIMGESGSYRVGSAIGAIWRRPASLKELLGLRTRANEAADRLGDGLRSLLAALP